MEVMVFAARAGNRILSAAAAVLIVLMMSYGGYSLWDNLMVSRGALLDGEILKYRPETNIPGENPSLQELVYLNPDVRGWLTIDGTHIDYPVVQGEDDMEYVNKDVLGEFSLSGSIFLSCLNSPDFSDGYSLVYGHHMDNGGMFSDVMEFLDEDYFQNHEAGTLSLAGESFDIRLFACAKVDAYCTGTTYLRKTG